MRPATNSLATGRHLGVLTPVGLFAVLLGATVSGVVPPPYRGLVLVGLIGVVAAALIVSLGNRALPWLVAGTIVATALAWSRFGQVSGVFLVGRFGPPLLLLPVCIWYGRRSPHAPRITMLAGGVLLAAALSALYSTDLGATLTKLVPLAVMLGAVVLIRKFHGEDQGLARVLGKAYVVVLASNVIFGLNGSLLGGRFRGWMINPNSLGGLAALALPLFAAIAFGSSGARRSRYTLAAVGAFLILIATGSRGGLVAASVALLGVMITAKATRSPLFVITLAVAAVSTPFVIASASRVELLSGVGRTGSSGRLAAWSVALDQIDQRPVVGWGYATTADRFIDQELEVSGEFQGGHFHNSYLEAAVELGLVGVLPLLAAAGLALRCLIRPPDGRLAWAVALALGGGMLAIFETGVLTPGALMFFPFWLGVAMIMGEAKSGAGVGAAKPALVVTKQITMARRS